MESIIRLVNQSLSNNCASACIAMILNEDVDIVTEQFHDKYIGQGIQPHEYLESKGIKFRHCMTAERSLTIGFVYILSVPSINIKGGSHYIVVERVEDGWFVYDPNDGKEGRFSYSNLNTGDDLYFPIVSWEPHYEFTRDNLKDYWNGK